LKISHVSKHDDVVRAVHHTFVDTDNVEIANLDLLAYKIGEKPVTYLEVKHFRKPDRDGHPKFHRISLGNRPRRSLEEHSVDALAFFDDTGAIDGGHDALDLGNLLYLREVAWRDRDRGRLVDVVHVHRHQLHVARKV